MEEQKQGDETEYSLKEFLDENQKSLSVVAVFIGLSVFWRSVTPLGLPYLSFLCILITIPVLIEVRRSARSQTNRSWTLELFLGLFASIIFFTVLNLVFLFPDNAIIHVSGVLGVIAFLPVLYLIHILEKKVLQYYYHKGVRQVEIEKGKGGSVEERNERVRFINANLDIDYEFIRDMAKFLSYLTIFLSFVVSAYLTGLISAFVDYEFRQNDPIQIEEPK